MHRLIVASTLQTGVADSFVLFFLLERGSSLVRGGAPELGTGVNDNHPGVIPPCVRSVSAQLKAESQGVAFVVVAVAVTAGVVVLCRRESRDESICDNNQERQDGDHKSCPLPLCRRSPTPKLTNTA